MSSGQKQTIVGEFFEVLGRQVFGGELSRDEDGDLCLWHRTKTSIEVKASGYESSYGFRLSVDQIERYERIREFPFDRVWYTLFAYQNRSRVKGTGGKVSTELSKRMTRAAINEHLGRSVMWCLLVDLSIVSRWKDKRPVSTTSILGHLGMRTVNLKCREVHLLMNGGLKTELESLGTPPNTYGVLDGSVRVPRVPDLFDQGEVKFPITAILPLQEMTSVQRTMRRRGFNLKRRT